MIDPVTAVQDSIDALALSLFEALRGVRDVVATPSSSSLVAPPIPMSAFQDIDARISHGEENNINNNSTNINSNYGTTTSIKEDDETFLAKQQQQQQQQAREKLLNGLNMDYFPPRAYNMLHPDYESFVLSYLGGKDDYAKELVDRFYSIQKTATTMQSTNSSGDDDTQNNDKIGQSSESDNGDIIVNDRTALQHQQPPPPPNNMQVKTAETMGKDDKKEKVEEDEECKQGQTNKVLLGEVGYEFRKEFDSGWYTGRVVEILPLAENGFDRRCVYSDGDIEDLRLEDLEQLAQLDLNHGSSSSSNDNIHQAKKPRLCIKLNVFKKKPPSTSTPGLEQSNPDDSSSSAADASSHSRFPMSQVEYIKLLHDAELYRDSEITTQLAANVLAKSNAVNRLVANLPGIERTHSMQLARINELIEENRRVTSELEDAYALANKRREEGVRMALRECTALALRLDEE